MESEKSGRAKYLAAQKAGAAFWYLLVGFMMFGPFVFLYRGRLVPLALIAAAIAATPFAGLALHGALERHPAVLLTAKESGRSPRSIASLAMLVPVFFVALLWAILPIAF